MVAPIHSVGNDTVKEAREAIDKTYNGEDDTEACVRYCILRRKTRHCKREVLSDKVEERIAYHCSDNGAPLPILKAFHIDIN